MSEPIAEHLTGAAPVETSSDEALSAESFRTSYLTLFYATLFHPVQAFQSISQSPLAGNRLLFFAIVSVVLVSALAPLVHMATQGGHPTSLVWSMPLSAICGTLIWGLIGFLISLLAYAFTGKSRVSIFLTLSGLATLPWVLMGPVSMLKVGMGQVGIMFFVLLALGVWLWSVLLFALALAETYEMTPDRVLIILVAPFAMSLVVWGWLFGFIDNVRLLAFHG